jgi:hypothetical protein
MGSKTAVPSHWNGLKTPRRRFTSDLRSARQALHKGLMMRQAGAAQGLEEAPCGCGIMA